MRNSWIIIGSIIGVASLQACAAHTAKPPVTASAAQPARTFTPPQQQAMAEAERATDGGNIHIDQSILALCPAVKPPHFDFDSSRLHASFEGTMTGLADCMTNGKLQGKRVLLVGRADPRGTEDYNLALGGRRAATVQDALKSLGVSASQLDLTSRGAIDATGTDEAGWAKDRRVDIKLEPNSI